MIEALLQAERLLVHGQVDQAERIYTGALDQDPLNSIAVVGLARVALERGDDQLALAHARHALDIDPQNAAALRLDARLSEVLEVRGEAAKADQPRPSDAQASIANANVRPSEQSVFNRNPSMADHRAMEERKRPTGDNQE